jgi:hypothetical protein
MATSTSPRSMRGAVAVSKSADVEPLGFLTWFSIPDEQVSLRTLRKQLILHGLPKELAPSDARARDAFRRACRELDGKHREQDASGMTVIRDNTVDMAVETPTDIVYQIATTVRDEEERVVNYPKALRAIFNKQTEEVSFNSLGEVKRSEVFPLQEFIVNYVEKNSSKVTGARVRAVVRNYLRNEPDEERGIEGLSGENLRGRAGGIYFIPPQHRQVLEQMSDMLATLYKGRAYLHFVPMADGASEREIVMRHHLGNAVEELEEAIAEARALGDPSRDRKPRKDAVAAAWSKYHAVLRRVQKYESILEDSQDDIHSKARILKSALDRLPDLP